VETSQENSLLLDYLKTAIRKYNFLINYNS
jgi:hypothetical protein